MTGEVQPGLASYRGGKNPDLLLSVVFLILVEYRPNWHFCEEFQAIYVKIIRAVKYERFDPCLLYI